MATFTNINREKEAGSKKVWATLITKTSYLPGLFTLDYSLKQHGSRYPLVAIYTDAFPSSGHHALDTRKISKRRVDHLLPTVDVDLQNDPRFFDTWTKLTAFSLTEYDRVVMLDSDMVVLKNMDELMEIELDPPSMEGKGEKVFAASHACACNPLKRPHYPKDWIPENCAFTSQHSDPDLAQKKGAPATTGVSRLNSGLLDVNPSATVYKSILSHLATSPKITTYQFPDQDLLADMFAGRWVGLPYVYNALKTLRTVHSPIWRDSEVKNVHYILSPKPWEEGGMDVSDKTHGWWKAVDDERKERETREGIVDGF